jgi:glycosyltransferase involved in cell wall biosynthesis
MFQDKGAIMKILFVNRLYDQIVGGVEAQSIALMNDLVARGHSVELLSWDRAHAQTWYPLDYRVVWHKLDIGDAAQKAGWRSRLRRQGAIRRIVSRARPDVVIAFQDGAFLAAATAMLGLGIPVVAAERNAPQRFDHLRSGKRRGRFVFQTFRLADCITVQWNDYIREYPAWLRERIVSIPNPVSPVAVRANPGGGLDARRRLLSVGRLGYPKNQSALVEAFAQIAEKAPNWRLLLVGAGEDERKLKQMVQARTLQDKVEFVGAVKEVGPYYLDSHLFCLPSRWEGFPNALAEAMAHGLPAVGYAECAGVGQLIKSGRNGLLAAGNGSPETLADCLLALMADDDMRRRMGEEAAATVAPYAPNVVFDQWESLFRDLAGRA